MMAVLHEPETWVAVAFLIFLGILGYVGVHKTCLLYTSPSPRDS